MTGSSEGQGNAEKRPYWCFISYRHADNKDVGRQWATWLHQTIENYEVPADLAGQVNGRGETIPQRIFPVFRDEEELPIDADLSSSIYRALDNSQCLLVICSPRAVDSTYVGREITYFKRLGKSGRIIAAMVDGEPNVSTDTAKQTAGFRPDQECFPAPLRHEVDAEGRLLGQLTEPIAADFRLADGSQGWTSPEAYRQELKRSGNFTSDAAAGAVEAYRQRSELMKLKIIAGVLGVDLASLTRRDAAYQLQLAQRRARVLRRWLTAVGVLALFAIAGGLLAYQKEREAEYQRDQTEQANLHLLTNTSAAHLREKDTRMAQGVILEVLRRATSAHPIEQAMTVAFQEARAADFQQTGMAIDGGAREAAYSPTGKTLVTAANDGTAAIWDVATG
ncbi:MAG: TIR domain-containing protein, partial [Rhodomicrobium sp.]